MRTDRPRRSLTTGQKLLCNLLLTAATLVLLWLFFHKPFLSPQSALNYMEKQQLLSESDLIFRYDDDLYGNHLAAGVSDSHFHLTYLRRDRLFWRRDNSTTVHSFPLEEGLPVAFLSESASLPGDPESRYFAAAAYCPQPEAVSGRAVITVAAGPYSTEARIVSETFLREKGVFLFFLPRPQSFSANSGEYQLMWLQMRVGDFLSNGVDVDVTLEVELYDAAGNVVAQNSRFFPAQ